MAVVTQGLNTPESFHDGKADGIGVGYGVRPLALPLTRICIRIDKVYVPGQPRSPKAYCAKDNLDSRFAGSAGGTPNTAIYLHGDGILGVRKLACAFDWTLA